MDILSLIEGGKSKEAKQSLRNSLQEGEKKHFDNYHKNHTRLTLKTLYNNYL